MALSRSALSYAQALHAGQSRSVDGAPFILHPREVAALLRRAGAPEHVVAAGALHDVIEKTATPASDLRKRFGTRVTRLVVAVTEDELIGSYRERKAALRRQVEAAGDEALMLFAADKISKARELGLESERMVRSAARQGCGGRSRGERLTHYRRCLTLLRERLPASSLVGQLDSELQRL